MQFRFQPKLRSRRFQYKSEYVGMDTLIKTHEIMYNKQLHNDSILAHSNMKHLTPPFSLCYHRIEAH